MRYPNSRSPVQSLVGHSDIGSSAPSLDIGINRRTVSPMSLLSSPASSASSMLPAVARNAEETRFEAFQRSFTAGVAINSAFDKSSVTQDVGTESWYRYKPMSPMTPVSRISSASPPSICIDNLTAHGEMSPRVVTPSSHSSTVFCAVGQAEALSTSTTTVTGNISERLASLPPITVTIPPMIHSSSPTPMPYQVSDNASTTSRTTSPPVEFSPIPRVFPSMGMPSKPSLSELRARHNVVVIDATSRSSSATSDSDRSFVHVAPPAPHPTSFATFPGTQSYPFCPGPILPPPMSPPYYNRENTHTSPPYSGPTQPVWPMKPDAVPVPPVGSGYARGGWSAGPDITNTPRFYSEEHNNAAYPQFYLEERSNANHPRFYFEDGNITITIYGPTVTVYRLHRYILEQHSPSFLSKGIYQNQASLYAPEVCKEHWDLILSILYTKDFINPFNEIKSNQDWIDVFTQARILSMRKIENVALERIEKDGSAIDRYILGKDYNVHKWLVPACTEMCLRKEPLSAEEGKRLGIDALVKINKMREDIKTSVEKFVTEQIEMS